jgi:phosphate-selective porin OprO/OprP
LLQGYYVQAGYFLHQAIAWWPKKMEVAARHADYRPDSKIKDQSETETTLTLNYFFNGHKNKLTTEVNYFAYQNIETLPANEWRFRIQWDISL